MPTKAEKLLAKGKSLEIKGRRDKALDIYRDACRAEPYDPDVWMARAEAAKAQGLTGEAAESFFHVCELYARGGLPEEALRVVKRVLEIDPGHGGARRLRRVLQEKAGIAEDEEPPRPAPAPAPKPAPVAAPAPPPAAPAAAAPSATAGALAAVAAKAATALGSAAPPQQAAAAPAAAVAAPVSPPPAAPPRRAASVPPPTPDESAPMIEIENVEPSRPLYSRPPSNPPPNLGASGPIIPPPGMSTADIALDSISLAERLDSSPASATGQSEIHIEEEGGIDVVQAVASTLTTSPLLSELDSDLVRHLIDVGKLVHKSAEEVVFKQGDLGTSLYLILAGEVSVVWEGKRERRELARLRPGAFFGEMALLTNTGRSASVLATKPSDFLEISRRSVRELIDREPRVLKLLMRFFRARLVGTLLQTSPLFKPFSREERRDLISRFRLRELAAEHSIIHEGSTTEGLFVVLVGKLEVLQQLKASHRKGSGAEGLNVLLGTLTSGDVFGEMSLLDGTAATATVRSRSRVWVLLLPRADFTDVVARHPQLREHLEQVAGERRERNKAATKEVVREDRLEPV